MASLPSSQKKHDVSLMEVVLVSTCAFATAVSNVQWSGLLVVAPAVLRGRTCQSKDPTPQAWLSGRSSIDAARMNAVVLENKKHRYMQAMSL